MHWDFANLKVVLSEGDSCQGCRHFRGGRFMLCRPVLGSLHRALQQGVDLRLLHCPHRQEQPPPRRQEPIRLTKDLYHPEEAAAILRLSRRTIYRMIRDGRLAGVRAGVRLRTATWKIKRETLAALLEDSLGEL